MGGIDESALDRLSLVTEMTKHIRVKAGGGEGQGEGRGDRERGDSIRPARQDSSGGRVGGAQGMGREGLETLSHQVRT